MSPRAKLILLATLVFLIGTTGCAVGPEHRSLRETGTSIELAEVPFFPQEDYQCGPAALATVLVDGGVDVSPDQLTAQVYVPERQGSLQAEMLAATRRHGKVPYLLPGKIAPLIEEMESGRPVLVFQNLGLERLPVWHYAVVIGYEPESELFLLRSGTDFRHRMRARSFLASWDRAGRWSMVVASPAEPPVTANALDWLRAAAPFESTGDLDIAARAYEAAVRRWPEQASAWTALGNVRYHEQRLADAAAAYREALARSTGHWTARNNLIRTLIDLGCPQRAAAWIDGAAPPDEMADVWASTLADLAEAGDGACADTQGGSR
jgi:tetratricopeptide (TPR) repeat protein